MPMMRATRRFSGAGVGNLNKGDLFWAENERNYLGVAELLGNAQSDDDLWYETTPGLSASLPAAPAQPQNPSICAENTEPSQ